MNSDDTEWMTPQLQPGPSGGCMHRGTHGEVTPRGGRQRTQPMQRVSSIQATRSALSTPFSGFKGRAGLPTTRLKASMVTCPPGGHWLMSASPAAIAAAYGAHPE